MKAVQFRKDSMEKPVIDSMTVFNSEEVDTKKQPMFLVNHWEFKDMIHISIQHLRI